MMKQKTVIDPLTFYTKQNSKEVIETKEDDIFNLSLNLKLFKVELALKKRRKKE